VREQIAQAIAEDDDARAYCEARERIEQPDQPEQQGLVYRIFDNARAAPVQTTMTVEEQKTWDERERMSKFCAPKSKRLRAISAKLSASLSGRSRSSPRNLASYAPT
jgi:hypothetical protein